MGKNYTIYFNDEADELLGNVAGKGTLINNLIIDYFNNDEENLRRKAKEAQTRANSLLAQLEDKITARKAKQTQEEMNSEKSKELKAKALKQEYDTKAPLRALQALFKAKKITYNEYYSFRDVTGWRLEDIKKYLKANKISY